MANTPGHGTILQLSISAVFTTIAQRVRVKPPAMERASIPSTTLDSTWHESIPGLRKGGDVELECNYDPAAATHAALLTAFANETPEAWKLIFNDAGDCEYAFSGWIKKFEPGEATTDGLVKLNITIEITGAVTVTP